MKKSPPFKQPKATATDADALRRWVQEWTLYKQVRTVSEDVPEKPAGNTRCDLAADLVAPFSGEHEVATGQIRLLAPSLCDADRPVYIAVLQDRSPWICLIAPYSPFATPATARELRTGRKSLPLSVLEVWNSRKVPRVRLRESWFVDRLSQTEMAQALALLATSKAETLARRLRTRVGPPLFHPQDPRWEYIDAEGGIWSRMADTSQPHIAEHAVYLRSNVLDEGREPIRLAASSARETQKVLRFAMPEYEATCQILFSPDSNTCSLYAVNRQGEPAYGVAGLQVTVPDRTGVVGCFDGFQAEIIGVTAHGFILTSADRIVRIQAAPVEPEYAPDSFGGLIDTVVRNPSAITTFADSELVALWRHRPQFAPAREAIAGELYLRRWLYAPSGHQPWRGESILDAAFDRAFAGMLLPLRSVHGTSRLPAAPAECSKPWMDVWNYLTTRIASFLRADGIIVVVCANKAEAIPVPFVVRRNEAEPGAVHDMDGVLIPEWSGARSWLRSQRGTGIQLGCSLVDTDRFFAGDSFELPAALGMARAIGKLPEYDPLAIVATGELAGDQITVVSGLTAKRQLAQNLGAKLFIAPAIDDTANSLGIPAGTALEAALDMISKRIADMGLAALDPRTICERLRDLTTEIHNGTLAIVDAQTRLARYERSLATWEPESKLVIEGTIRARALRALLANHDGQPDLGKKAATEAAALAQQHRLPLLYVNAMASQVVSLADLGHLDESEATARRLLGWVQEDFAGTSEEQLRAEMIACGVLGGQPLLYKALQGAGCGTEALMHLKKALQLARDINLADDICRDAVQIALWHALLSPSDTESAVREAEVILSQQPLEAARISRDYLCRVRFLGAYRLLLTTGDCSSETADWALPPMQVGGSNWLLATSLKYRGAIHARRSRHEEAESDFRRALDLLRPEPSPMMQFIRGTIALQAAESLLKSEREEAAPWLALARETFSALLDFMAGPLAAQHWLQRVAALEARAVLRPEKNPQRIAMY